MIGVMSSVTPVWNVCSWVVATVPDPPPTVSSYAAPMAMPPYNPGNLGPAQMPVAMRTDEGVVI